MTVLLEGQPVEVEDCPNCQGLGEIITGPAGLIDPLTIGAFETEGCPTCNGTGTR